MKVEGVVTLDEHEKTPAETWQGPLEVEMVNASTVPAMCMVARV